MLRAFLKDSVIYAVPTVASRGLSLLLVPLYTRVLSPADYGSLDLITVFASIINLTIALEVSQGLARYFAGEPDPLRKIIYASSAFWFSLFCNTVFVVAALLFTSQLAPLIMGRPGLDAAFQIGLVYIWVGSVFYLVQNQFRWELRSNHYAMVSLMMVFVTAAASVWFTVVLHWGLSGLLLGMVIGCAVATGVGLWWLRNTFRFHFGTRELGEMLSFSTPLVVSGIAVWANLYVDRMMINHFFTVEEVGIYGIGYRVASIAGILMIGFQGALTPLVYAHYREPETPRQLARIFRLFVAFSLALYLALTLFSEDILRVMTTQTFYRGASLVVFLVPAILFGSMYVFAPGIGIAKKTYIIVWINVVGSLVNLLTSLIMMPIFGMSGAAIATLVSYTGIFAAYVVIGQTFYRIPHRWLPIICSAGLAFCLAFVIPGLQVDTQVRWVLSVLGLVGLFSTFVGLGLVAKEEVRDVFVALGARIKKGSSS